FTILFLFLIGSELFDVRVGLLAAALYSFTALAIQLAHFYTVDSFTTCFVTATFYFAARLLHRHRWRDYLVFGLLLGLAMASKVSIFPLALILIMALVMRVMFVEGPLVEESFDEADEDTESQPPTLWQRFTSPDGRRAALGLILAGIVTL